MKTTAPTKFLVEKLSARSVKARQRGSIVMPAIIVIVILGILAAGAIYGLPWIDSAKVSNELQELSSLRASVLKQSAASGTDFSNLAANTNYNLAKLNFFPSARVTYSGTTATISNQWKGTITTSIVSVAGGSNNAMSFSYTGYPSSACREVAQEASKIATAITIGTTSVLSVGSPFDFATTLTQCDAGNDNVTIAYTFSR